MMYRFAVNFILLADYIVTIHILFTLTHWGRVTHICVSKLCIIGSDNGLSPNRCQAIIWTNAGMLLIRTLATNVSEIMSKIHTFSFKKINLKILPAKWWPFVLASVCWFWHCKFWLNFAEVSKLILYLNLYATVLYWHCILLSIT